MGEGEEKEKCKREMNRCAKKTTREKKENWQTSNGEEWVKPGRNKRKYSSTKTCAIMPMHSRSSSMRMSGEEGWKNRYKRRKGNTLSHTTIFRDTYLLIG
eukprot:TRINITY_DN3566_c0_g1_i1.p2 TRINITY_DN3566_c0_g1~~TRINITY_DN3566_c0_g1_i1.p2  ORF type:complete len:100 (-),score=5.74 TRINITY_DN3566_c0_g1_i1:296-595(-)